MKVRKENKMVTRRGPLTARAAKRLKKAVVVAAALVVALTSALAVTAAQPTQAQAASGAIGWVWSKNYELIGTYAPISPSDRRLVCISTGQGIPVALQTKTTVGSSRANVEVAYMLDRHINDTSKTGAQAIGYIIKEALDPAASDGLRAAFRASDQWPAASTMISQWKKDAKNLSGPYTMPVVVNYDRAKFAGTVGVAVKSYAGNFVSHDYKGGSIPVTVTISGPATFSNGSKTATVNAKSSVASLAWKSTGKTGKVSFSAKTGSVLPGVGFLKYTSNKVALGNMTAQNMVTGGGHQSASGTGSYTVSPVTPALVSDTGTSTYVKNGTVASDVVTYTSHALFFGATVTIRADLYGPFATMPGTQAWSASVGDAMAPLKTGSYAQAATLDGNGSAKVTFTSGTLTKPGFYVWHEYSDAVPDKLTAATTSFGVVAETALVPHATVVTQVSAQSTSVNQTISDTAEVSGIGSVAGTGKQIVYNLSGKLLGPVDATVSDGAGSATCAGIAWANAPVATTFTKANVANGTIRGLGAFTVKTTGCYTYTETLTGTYNGQVVDTYTEPPGAAVQTTLVGYGFGSQMTKQIISDGDKIVDTITGTSGPNEEVTVKVTFYGPVGSIPVPPASTVPDGVPVFEVDYADVTTNAKGEFTATVETVNAPTVQGLYVAVEQIVKRSAKFSPVAIKFDNGEIDSGATPKGATLNADTNHLEAQVGTTLTFAGLSVHPSSAAVKHQWFRDNKPIPGVTGASYRAAADDQGHWVRVQTVATAAGHNGNYNNSLPILVPVDPCVTTPVDPSDPEPSEEPSGEPTDEPAEDPSDTDDDLGDQPPACTPAPTTDIATLTNLPDPGVINDSEDQVIQTSSYGRQSETVGFDSHGTITTKASANNVVVGTTVSDTAIVTIDANTKKLLATFDAFQLMVGGSLLGPVSPLPAPGGGLTCAGVDWTDSLGKVAATIREREVDGKTAEIPNLGSFTIRQEGCYTYAETLTAYMNGDVVWSASEQPGAASQTVLSTQPTLDTRVAVVNLDGQEVSGGTGNTGYQLYDTVTVNRLGNTTGRVSGWLVGPVRPPANAEGCSDVVWGDLDAGIEAWKQAQAAGSGAGAAPSAQVVEPSQEPSATPPDATPPGGTGDPDDGQPAALSAEDPSPVLAAVDPIQIPKNGAYTTPTITVDQPGCYTYVLTLSVDANAIVSDVRHEPGIPSETALIVRPRLAEPPVISTTAHAGGAAVAGVAISDEVSVTGLDLGQLVTGIIGTDDEKRTATVAGELLGPMPMMTDAASGETSCDLVDWTDAPVAGKTGQVTLTGDRRFMTEAIATDPKLGGCYTWAQTLTIQPTAQDLRFFDASQFVFVQEPGAKSETIYVAGAQIETGGSVTSAAFPTPWMLGLAAVFVTAGVVAAVAVSRRSSGR